MYVSLEQESIVISRSLIFLTQASSASHPDYQEMSCFTDVPRDTGTLLLNRTPGIYQIKSACPAWT